MSGTRQTQFQLTTGKAAFSTHTPRQASKAIGATKMSQVGEEWRSYDVIGVDEGQFFDDVSLVLPIYSDRYIRRERS